MKVTRVTCAPLAMAAPVLAESHLPGARFIETRGFDGNGAGTSA